MAPHSSTLAWKIRWIEEPGRLQSMGSRRVPHDWMTSLSLFTFVHWRRKWQPIPVFSLENPRDGGSWWAAVYGVTQSQTWLKGLSSSSSSSWSYVCVCAAWSWNYGWYTGHIITGEVIGRGYENMIYVNTVNSWMVWWGFCPLYTDKALFSDVLAVFHLLHVK